MSLTQLGPGLTTQFGPFKTHKSDIPKFRKTPWKGGGVAGGGTLHAGNGNWQSTMTPKVIRAVPYPLKPSQYAGLVGPAMPSTYYTKQKFGRAYNEMNTVGRPGLNPGTQQPGQGNQGGRQIQGEPAVQNEAGEGDEDQPQVASNEPEQSPEPEDREPMEMNNPANAPLQNNYNTTQQIVQPLIAEPMESNDTMPHESAESITATTVNTSTGRSGVATTTTHVPSVVVTATQHIPMYHAESIDQGNTVRALNHRIASLNDEINQIRNEHQEMIGFAGVAVHQGVRENENLRREGTARITELENEIAIANARLEEQGTSFANAQAATSRDMAQQAQDIANFFSNEVGQAERRGAFEAFSENRRSRTQHQNERNTERGGLVNRVGEFSRNLPRHLPSYEESELRRRARNSQLTERTAQTYRERAMQSQTRNHQTNSLRAAAQASRNPTQGLRNRAQASRRSHQN